MKQDLILLFGKSGSGKNYLAKTLNLKQVISHTTRPIRKTEFYVTDKYFVNKIHGNTKQIVAYNKRGDYEYWATEHDLLGKDVYIIDIPGIRMLLSSEKLVKMYNFKVVYIKCSLFKRIRNMFRRGDSIKDIINRLKIDKTEFKDWNSLNPIVIKV